jgi:hypothetical protein
MKAGAALLIFRRALVTFLVFAAGGAGAFDWPVEERRLMAAFGESRYGAFLGGIYLSCGETAVYPIADGEVIFSFEEGGGPHALARPNGSFLAMQHEGGVQSIYSHLKPGTVEKEKLRLRARPKQIEATDFDSRVLAAVSSEAERELLKAVFTRDGGVYALKDDLPRQGRAAVWGILSRIRFVDTVGMAGDTGLSEGVHLALSIIDVEQLEILNPIKKDKPPLLPPLVHPVPSRRQGPVITGIFSRRGETLRELSEGLAVSPGEVEILAGIYERNDFVPFSRNIAPYKLYLAVSGKIVTSITLDGLEERNNRLVVNDTTITHDDLYRDQWFYSFGRVSLVEGNTVIQVGAESFLGDANNLDLSLKVVP